MAKPTSILVDRFIDATRGASLTSKYDPLFLSSFAEFASAHADRDKRLVNIELHQIHSHRFDVETLSAAGQNHVVLDQSFLELACRLNEMVIPLVMGGLEDPAPRTIGTALASFLAVRHSLEGRFGEALVLALLPGEPRGLQRSELNWRRASSWALVQACFALAHELGHCLTPDGYNVAARSWTTQFEEEMLPMCRFYDTQLSSSPSNPFLDHVEDIRMRSDSDEEFVRLMQSFQVAQSHRRDLSRVEMIDSVIDESSRLGEEVLCDYSAFRLVDAVQSSFGLPADEVLFAAYCGMAYQVQLSSIGTQLRSEGPWALPVPRMVRVLEESNTRLWFGKLCAMGLSNANQHAWEQTLEGKPPQELVVGAAKLRASRMNERLADFDNGWYLAIAGAAMDAGPLHAIAHYGAGGVEAKLGSAGALTDAVRDALGTRLHPDVLTKAPPD